MFKEITAKVHGIASDIKCHWSKPAKGNYVSYKEILSLGIGGMGVQFFTIVLAYFSLSSSSTLMGATLGIQPLHMQFIGIIMSGIGTLIAIARNSMIDNTHTKMGKFRPYILLSGIPIIVLAFIFVFLDFDKMSYIEKLSYATAFTFVIGCILPLYADSYNSLSSVMTPNSEERGKIVAINAFLYSVAPTIYYFIVPILADKTGGYTDIRTYRWVVMPFAVIGVALGMVAAFGTKERIVVSKTYVPKVNTIRSSLSAFKNKYWVITVISATIGFLEGGISNLFNWSFMYDNQNYKLMGVANTILGTSATIAFVLAPLMIKKIGARGALLLKEGMNVVFIALMLFTYKNVYFFFLAWYLNQIFSSLVLVVNPVIGADTKDYHQYLTGERIDAAFATAQMLFTPIGYLTGMVIPYFFEAYGITQNYDILFDPMVRNNVFRILCILAIAGAFLQFAPLVFYDLTQDKHRNIITVLKVRAMLEDYSNGVLSNDELTDTMSQLEQTEKYYYSDNSDLNALSEHIKKAKALSKRTKEQRSFRKAEIKKAKKAFKKAKDLNTEKSSAEILINELNKFKTPNNIYRINVSEKLVSNHISNLNIKDGEYLALALALPENTRHEKSFKKAEIKRAKRIERMPKKILRKYPDGIAEPNPDELSKALLLPDISRDEKKAKRQAIKTAERNIRRYQSIAAEYVAAQKLLRDYENYGKLEEIRTLYKSALKESEMVQ